MHHHSIRQKSEVLIPCFSDTKDIALSSDSSLYALLMSVISFLLFLYSFRKISALNVTMGYPALSFCKLFQRMHDISGIEISFNTSVKKKLKGLYLADV